MLRVLPADVDRQMEQEAHDCAQIPEEVDHHDATDGRPGVEYPDSEGNDIAGDEWH